jgi:hypothetical protein
MEAFTSLSSVLQGGREDRMREKVRLVSALRGLFAGEEGLPAPLTSASAPNLFLGALAHGPKKPSALFQFSVSLRDLVALQVEAGASATLTADDAGPLLSGLADKGWLGTADAAGHWTGGADIGAVNVRVRVRPLTHMQRDAATGAVTVAASSGSSSLCR